MNAACVPRTLIHWWKIKGENSWMRGYSPRIRNKCIPPLFSDANGRFFPPVFFFFANRFRRRFRLDASHFKELVAARAKAATTTSATATEVAAAATVSRPAALESAASAAKSAARLTAKSTARLATKSATRKVATRTAVAIHIRVSAIVAVINRGINPEYFFHCPLNRCGVAVFQRHHPHGLLAGAR